MGAAMDLVEGGVTGNIELAAPSVRDHPIRVGIGVLVAVLGIAAAVGLDAVPDLPAGPTLVTAMAGLSLAFGFIVLTRRLFTEYSTATTADVEYRGSVTVPGAQFDDLLTDAIHGMGGVRVTARQTLVDRLTDATVFIYGQAARLPGGEAREAVESGRWTDDPVAGGFLAGETALNSTSDQLRRLAGRRSTLSTQIDSVLTELAELAPGLSPADLGTGEDDATHRTVRTTDVARRQVDRRTERWTGLAGLGLIAIGFGLWASHANVPPSLVVATASIAGAAGYVYLSSPPPVSLAAERRFSEADPAPGDEVTVTLSVTNESDELLPDLRVVDGVAPALRVVDGSPRYGTALRPGESLTFSYTVEAVRGDHAFDPVHVVVRDFSGALERERHVPASSGAVFSCALELVADEDVPVHAQTAQRVGRVVTDAGGSGIELHSVREYQRGDPLSRIDWNRVARTGEFATLLFREEHAATVVFLVDAREEAYVAPNVEAPSAVEHAVEAADVVVSSLVAAGDSVGLGALSPEWCWLEPRGGNSQRARARRLLETHSAFDGRRPDGAFHGELKEKRLRRELPGDAQLVLCSPLCDDDAVTIARQLHARGHPVTVISPDVTALATTGQRLATVERVMRISRLRRSGIRVIDWDTDRPLETAIEATQQRWSA